MADENKTRPQNGETGRDPSSGRFARGNSCARGRRARGVDVQVEIPPHLKNHAGVRAAWPLLTRLAVEGNREALATLTGLCLGTTKPASIGAAGGDGGAGFEDDGGETVDEGCVEDMREMVERMSPAERNAARSLLRQEFDG